MDLTTIAETMRAILAHAAVALMVGLVVIAAIRVIGEVA
jgi:hypothetical protein